MLGEVGVVAGQDLVAALAIQEHCDPAVGGLHHLPLGVDARGRRRLVLVPHHPREEVGQARSVGLNLVGMAAAAARDGPDEAALVAVGLGVDRRKGVHGVRAHPTGQADDGSRVQSARQARAHGHVGAQAQAHGVHQQVAESRRGFVDAPDRRGAEDRGRVAGLEVQVGAGQLGKTGRPVQRVSGQGQGRLQGGLGLQGPVADLAELAVLEQQTVGRGQALDVRVEGGLTLVVHQALGQEAQQGVRAHPAQARVVGQQGLGLGGETELAVALGIVEGLHPEAVPRAEEQALGAIPQGQAPHPVEAVDAVRPPLEVSLQHHLRICVA